MKRRSQDDFVRTALRVPPDLHAAIHEAAGKSGRTFNAEIVDRLQASFVEADVVEADIVHRTTQSVLASLVQFGGLDLKTVQEMAAKAEASMQKGAPSAPAKRREK